MRVSSWSALFWIVIASAAFLAMAMFLFWASIGVFVFVAIALLNLVYVPRVAAHLRVERTVVDALLLLMLAVAGWALANGVQGSAFGVLIWLGGIGLPRLMARRFGRVHVSGVVWRPHVPRSSSPLNGVTCPNCGAVSFQSPGTTDPSCPVCTNSLPTGPYSLSG